MMETQPINQHNIISSYLKLFLDLSQESRILINHKKYNESIVLFVIKLIQAPLEHMAKTKLTEPEKGEFFSSIGDPLKPQLYFEETLLLIEDSSMFTINVLFDTSLVNL